METQDEMRGKFEKLEEVKNRLSQGGVYWDGKKYSTLPFMSSFVSTAIFLNGAWYAFQERQKKIDICEALRNEQFNKLWGIMQLIDDHDNNEKPASFYIKKIKEILK